MGVDIDIEEYSEKNVIELFNQQRQQDRQFKYIIDSKKELMQENPSIISDLKFNVNGIEKTIQKCWSNFILVEKELFSDLGKMFSFQEKANKCIYIIGNRQFIIPFEENNCIEICFSGVGQLNTYDIFLLKFFDKIDINNEIAKIGTDIWSYLNRFGLKKDKDGKLKTSLISSNALHALFIDLNEQAIQLKIDDLQSRKGLINSEENSSKLNSVIHLLYSMKEIKEYLLNDHSNNFKKFRHIYVLAGYLSELFSKLNSTTNDDKEKNIETKDIKYALNFIDLKIEEQPIIKFILKFLIILNDEFYYKDKAQFINSEIPSQEIISYENKATALNNFQNYYSNQYQHTIISNNINFIQYKYECNFCQNRKHSFQALPYYEINLNEIITNNNNQMVYIPNNTNNINKINFDLKNFFNSYQYDNKNFCDFCKKPCSSYKSMEQCSNYLIISLTPCQYVNFEISNEIQILSKKYKLIGLIYKVKENNEKERYFAALLNYDNKWMKFDGEEKSELEENNLKNINYLEILLYQVFD